MMLWFGLLIQKALLKNTKQKSTVTMAGENAIRNHPIFGPTTYGLGPTVSTDKGIVQLGQSGFAPGFACMDFYFPSTKLSVIVLENMVHNPNDLKKTFYYHTTVLELAKKAF